MRITLPSGTTAALARPATADDPSRRGLVIAPDIFGLRPLFEDMAERLAADWDMVAVAVDPFPGMQLGPDVESRYAAVGQLNDDAHLRDLEEAAGATGCTTAGLMGFCMGGMYCYKAARSDRFARIAAFYGQIEMPEPWKGEGQRDPLAYLRAGHADRVIAFLGGRDHYTPPEEIAALEATGATAVVYPEAEHGFAHDPSRPAHRGDDAADAFGRAQAWLTAPAG